MKWLLKEGGEKHSLNHEGVHQVELKKGYLHLFKKEGFTQSFRIQRYGMEESAFQKVLWVEYYEGSRLEFARFELVPDIPGIEERLEQAMSGPQDFLSPIAGKVLSVAASESDILKAGESIMVIEAMKMENPMKVEERLEIIGVNVKPGDVVETDQLLFRWQRPQS